MNDGRRVRSQGRQVVVDGFVDGAVSGDGKEGAVAEGEGMSFLTIQLLNQTSTFPIQLSPK